MTAILWTDTTKADFLGLVEWLTTKNPDAAARVGRHILDTVEHLAEHPLMGKPGRSPDTRELVVTTAPYVVVYSVTHGDHKLKLSQIFVLRILHNAMLWPPV
ncbi:MAG: type II toxin-antitoxin system RelE/ParE family toxin [Magnetococcales bacterium]|nr:type II toxin-antitoxin system RelE/ParE family toxin [Magnetococcales bacterium]